MLKKFKRKVYIFTCYMQTKFFHKKYQLIVWAV
jgi:hypothetical protein